MTPATGAVARARRIAAPGGLAVAVTLGLGLVHVVDPNQGGYPTCPWLATTGTFCPGCGTLRALHAMTQGDVGGAMAMNPLLVVMAPLLVVGLLAWLRQSWTGGVVAMSRVPRGLPSWAGWTFLALVVGFWVARNVAQFAWLAPG